MRTVEIRPPREGEEPTHAALPTEGLRAISAYLQRQPWDEVNALIGILAHEPLALVVSEIGLVDDDEEATG